MSNKTNYHVPKEQKLKILKKALNLHPADEYDVAFRRFDDKVEIIGLINDPTYDIKDFENREYLFPKRWVTLSVISRQFYNKIGSARQMSSKPPKQIEAVA